MYDKLGFLQVLLLVSENNSLKWVLMEEFYYLFFFKGHILVYSYKNKQCLGGIWELVFKFYYSNIELE